MRDSTCIETPLATPDFLGGSFPSLDYSLDMLSEFQPQQPSDFFVPTTTAPLDFVSDLFPLPSVSAAPPALHQLSAEAPESPPANQAVSSSSSGQSPGKERKGSRERQATGRWSTRDKGPVSETRKLEVNREAQRRFRQRQKVLVPSLVALLCPELLSPLAKNSSSLCNPAKSSAVCYRHGREA